MVIDLRYAALAVLVFLDVLTAATHAVLFHVNLARLLTPREPVEKSRQKVMVLLHARSHLEASLHLTHLVVRFLAAGLLLAIVAPPKWTLSDSLSATGILLLAALLVFLFEEVAEGQASRHPEAWAVRLAGYARALMVLQTPILALAHMLRHSNREAAEGTGTVTEDELMNLVDAGQQEGVLEQDEREMIYSIFRLGDTLVREIMVPRIYVTALEADMSLAEAVDTLLAAGHSRAPVYDDTVDHILGLVYAKDLLRAWREGSQIQSLRELLREAYFVPEAKKVDELMDEMQARRIHMAIVVDEYGGVAGLLTLEDIVEEIVGEIRDEYDQAEEMPYQVLGADEYLFLGRVDLDDFNSVMHTDLPRDEAETLGGFIYNRIGRVPLGGEALQVGDLLLTVEQVSGRRIRKIRAQRRSMIPNVEEEKKDADA